MRPISSILDRVLRAHDPYPAWVYGRGLQPISANRAAESLFPGLCQLAPDAIVDMWFADGPFRAFVQNWPAMVWAGVEMLRREARRTSDPDVRGLLARAEKHMAKVPIPLELPDLDVPVVCPRFKIGGSTVRTISTMMRFDTAVDATASELRVELMFPADAESDAFFRSMAAMA